MARPRFVSRLLYAAGRLRERVRAETDTESAQRDSEVYGPEERPPDRPKGCLLWFHATSPGDTGASIALAQELARLRGEPVHTLITTTEQGVFIPSVVDGAVRRIVPDESSSAVDRFFEQWSPDLGVVLGPPGRPLLFARAAEAGTLMFLAAARRGDAAERGRLPYLSSLLLEHFRTCLAASAADAEVYRRDAPQSTPIEITGPLSDTAIALTCSDKEHAALSSMLGGRPTWLAAHVMDDEVDAAEAAQRHALRAAHRLLLIIVPHDPDSGPAIAAKLEAQGWRTSLRSAGGEPAEDVQIYIADTVGEMGLWYRLAPITFVGGSLMMGCEPSDPFDPAALGSVVVHGPNTGVLNTRFRRLIEAEAHFPVGSREDLGPAILTLLSPDRAATLAHAGWTATTESAPVIERLATLMDEALDERDGA